MYNQTYKVKAWVLLDIEDPKRREKVVSWFKDADALIQKWPALAYKEEVLKYADMGYPMVKKTGSYKAPNSLLMRAAVDAVKKTVSSQSKIMLTNKAQYFSATITSDSDYELIMNMILNTMEPIYKSQCFQVFERCHSTYAKPKYSLFVTPEGGAKNVLTDIAENVIIITDKDGGDFNIKDVPSKYIPKKFDTDFVNYLSQIGIL